MAQIQFNSAKFHGFTFKVGPKRGKGGAIVIAEFSAPWTDTNRKEGDWKELPNTVSGNVNLIPGELACTTLKFKPGGGLSQHEFSIDVSRATAFSCFVPTKDDEDRELRFKVETTSLKAAKILHDYGRTAGDAKGTLKLTLDGDGQQSLVPDGVSPSDEAKQAVLKDAD